MDGCKIEVQFINTIDKGLLEIEQEYHLKSTDNLSFI